MGAFLFVVELTCALFFAYRDTEATCRYEIYPMFLTYSFGRVPIYPPFYIGSFFLPAFRRHHLSLQALCIPAHAQWPPFLPAYYFSIPQNVYITLAGLPVLSSIAPILESATESIINMTPLKPSPEEVS